MHKNKNRVVPAVSPGAILAKHVAVPRLARVAITAIVVFQFLDMTEAYAAFPVNLPRQPNIILILADDLGVGDISSYNPSSQLSLPNIERLADEGLRFTDAHSTGAHCMPTRYSTLTGNYAWRGLWEYGLPLYYGVGDQIPEGQWTIGDILKSTGYETAFIGKHHMGGDMYPQGSDTFARGIPETDLDFARGFFNGPLEHGFDYSHLSISGNGVSPYAYFENDLLVGDPNDLFIWTVGTYGDSQIIRDGIGLPTWDSSLLGRIHLDKTLSYIRERAPESAGGDGKPFFVYYAMTTVHRPWTPPATFNGEPIRDASGIGARGDIIVEMDFAVGEVVRELERLGMLRNTLIIFTSDNGAEKPAAELALGHNSSAGLRGQKGSLHEGGHRVPLLVQWGNGTPEGSYIPPGTVSHETVGLNDLAATIAALTQTGLPSDQANDSYNIAPLLFGESQPGASRENLILVTREDINGDIMQLHEKHSYILRDGEWKLVLDTDNTPVASTPIALYDLDSDLFEQNNLVDDPTQLARIDAMKANFDSLHASARTVDPLVIDLDGDGVVDALDNCDTVVNPSQADSDGDDFGDLCDDFSLDPAETTDTDNDGTGDNGDTDDDDDGLTDVEESAYLTDPLLSDTDGDGFSDGTEVANGSDPLDRNSFSLPNDLDGDSVPDGNDNCPTATNPGQENSDTDSLGNACDNCTDVANETQHDTDGDSIGNYCDPDVALPNDCMINFLDLNVYKANFFQTGSLDTDNDGDGETNFGDLQIAKAFFFGPPGPSAHGCN